MKNFAFPLLMAALTACGNVPGGNQQSMPTVPLPAVKMENPPATPLSEPADARPNIVFVLLDDAAWDTLGKPALEHYPTLLEIAEQGLYVDKFFLTTPLCGPSRASILRGQFGHNTGILNNWPPNGGFEEFHSRGYADNDMGALMSEAGYSTYFVGKYQNNGFPGASGNSRYVPPGWDRFYGTLGNQYFETAYIDNGKRGHHESGSFRSDHEFDIAVEYLEAHEKGPFLLYFSPFNPHASPDNIYPPRHASLGGSAPRTPNFNEADTSDKVGGINQLPLVKNSGVEKTYRARLRSVAAIDDQLQRLLDIIPDNTYVFISSDNGFHLGEHRTLNKMLPYERVISTPMIIKGPGVELGTLDAPMFANIDLLPTFLDIAGTSTPDFVDGKSFLSQIEDHAKAPLRDSILIESWGDYRLGSTVLPMEYKAVRTLDQIYIEWSHGPTEHYDLSIDPWQLESSGDTSLQSLLKDWQECSGSGCL